MKLEKTDLTTDSDLNMKEIQSSFCGNIIEKEVSQDYIDLLVAFGASDDMISALTCRRISFTFDFIWDALFLISGVVVGYSWIVFQMLG